MRFELIDTVLERDDNRLVGIKAVTAAEEYLADHFPTFAVLPGVMMLEAMVQAARTLLGPGPDGRQWVLAEARNVRYGNMVRPGQQLRVEVTMTKADDHTRTFQGRGTVDGEVAVQGKFKLRPRQDARPAAH